MNASKNLLLVAIVLWIKEVKQVENLLSQQGKAVEKKHSKAWTMEEVEVLYHRHIETVYGVCFALMGNRCDAEDAVQAVFLKLMRNPTDFSSAEHEKAWLITTARNQCRDIHRQWWRRKTTALSDQAPEASAGTYEPGALAAALMALPANQRILLYLHYYEGYKLSEIAMMLGLNLNTVKTRVRCARQQLKFELTEDPDDEELT
jgi:RNA polymerase sigma factor (sigma-70 family)